MADEINVIVVDRGRKFLYLRYTDPLTNKRIEKSAGTSNKRQAQKLAGEWQKEIETGTATDRSRLTWEEFRESYQALHGQSLSSETQTRIDVVFNSFEGIIGAHRLASVTSQHIVKWQATLRTEGKSEHTIASYTGHLKAAFNWAVQQALLQKSPVIKKPKRASTSEAMKGRPITSEEFDRLIEQVKEPYMKPCQHAGWKQLLTGLWWSGLRLEESLNLYWDRLDRISIDLSSGRPLLRIPAEMEKGNRDRLYPVATEFAEMILAVPEKERHGAFFTVVSKSATPYSRSRHRIGKIIATLGRKAGIVTKVDPKSGEKSFASAHDLRRSFGERWAKRVEAPFLQKMMRHSAISTTLRYYASRDALDAASHIDQAFNRAMEGRASNGSPETQSEGQKVTLEVTLGKSGLPAVSETE
ncbi:MAG: tyrosine-type recombinase/integrase [Planctomycetaceae bacterium]